LTTGVFIQKILVKMFLIFNLILIMESFRKYIPLNFQIEHGLFVRGWASGVLQEQLGILATNGKKYINMQNKILFQLL